MHVTAPVLHLHMGVVADPSAHSVPQIADFSPDLNGLAGMREIWGQIIVLTLIETPILGAQRGNRCCSEARLE